MSRYEKCLPLHLNMNVTHATGPTGIKYETTADLKGGTRRVNIKPNRDEEQVP
jgi:hypothetical protein